MKTKISFWALIVFILSPQFGFAAEGNHNTRGAGFEHVHAFTMDSAGQTLFLGAHTGLFRSEDGGRRWKRAALPANHSHLDVMTVTPDLREAKTIYVGTHEAGVFKSTDGGLTWKQANNGLGGMDVHRPRH
jgi:photosystem II stability/assembly factor-like uncharacterized protein